MPALYGENNFDDSCVVCEIKLTCEYGVSIVYINLAFEKDYKKVRFFEDGKPLIEERILLSPHYDQSWFYEVKDEISIYISYYTMQFIHTSIRQDFIDKIYKTLEWGGALFLFEKVRAPDARFQDYMTQMYTEYKIKQDYTPDNIISKAQSLKGVLEPFSHSGNIDLLKRAGFKDIMTIYKYICFEGFLAIK